MKNIKHFAGMIREHGNPQFPTDQFQRMMNIVFIEAKLKGYYEVKESMKGTPDANKWDLRIRDLNELLKTLTGNTEPKELVHELSTGKKAKAPVTGSAETPWPEYDIYERFNKGKH